MERGLPRLKAFHVVDCRLDGMTDDTEIRSPMDRGSRETTEQQGAVRCRCTFLRFLGQYDEAIECYEMQLNCARQTGDKSDEICSYWGLGSCYQSIGQYEKSIEQYTMLLNITKQIGDKSGEDTSHCGLSLCHYSLGQYHEALQHSEMHFNIAKENGDKAATFCGCLTFGRCFLSLGHYDKAIEVLAKCVDIASWMGDRVRERVSCSTLGTCYFSLKQYEKAIEYHKSSLNIATEIGEIAGQLEALRDLGNCCRCLGQHDEAIKHVKMSLKIAKETEDEKAAGCSFSELGKCYASLRQYDKAIKHQEKGLKIAKETGEKSAEGCRYCSLGDCYCSIDNYDKAIECYKNRMDVGKETGDKTAELCGTRRLGACYSSTKQYGKAIYYHERSLDIAKQIEDKPTEESANNYLGECFSAIGRFDKAIQHFEANLDIAKHIGDKHVEGINRCALGSCYHSVGRYDKAIEHYKMRMDVAKDVGDKSGEACGHGGLGRCYHSLGQCEKAKHHFQRNLDIAKQIGDTEREGRSHGGLGNCCHSLGQHNAARLHYETQLNIAEQNGDKATERDAYRRLVDHYCDLGLPEKAVNYANAVAEITKQMNEVGAVQNNVGVFHLIRGRCYDMHDFEVQLNDAKQKGNQLDEGCAHANLGNCYLGLGKYAQAITHYQSQQHIARQIGDKRSEMKSYGSLGLCYQFLGQYDKARQYHEMDLHIAEEISDKAGKARCCNNLGSCYNALGQFDEAVRCLEMSLSIAEQIEYEGGKRVSYAILSVSYWNLGQPAKAFGYLIDSLNISEQIGDLTSKGYGYSILGSFQQALRNYIEAFCYHSMHLVVTKQTSDKAGEAQAHMHIGECEFALGFFSKAELSLRESLQCYEQLFKDAPEEDQYKVSISDTPVATCYRLLTDILLTQEKTGEALAVAERGRSRALAELLASSYSVRCGQVAAEATVLTLPGIRQVVATLGTTVLFFLLRVPFLWTWIIQPNGDVKHHQQCLAVGSQAKMHQSRKEFTSYVEKGLEALINKATNSPRARCEVEDRSLSFLYSSEKTELSIHKSTGPVYPSSTTPADSPVQESNVLQDRHPSRAPLPTKEMTMATLSVSLEEIEREDCPLKELYKNILEPVRHFVKGSHVVIVPEGHLPLVPFVALIDESGHYVAESLQVRLLPSLSTTKLVIDHPQESENQGRPLIIADPDVGEVKMGEKVVHPPALPHAKTEAEKVGELLHVKPLTGKHATKEAFLQNMESANVIHMAAHGDMERGEILLAPSPAVHKKNVTEEDVLLKISNLEQKSLRAKLVVLSCCHSGRGEVRAEGVIGIARAFLGAGARAVLVALWAIDDKATMYFMEEFYERLVSGEKTSEALGGAMKAMRETEEFRDPHYWAPFVHIGEDATLFKKNEH